MAETSSARALYGFRFQLVCRVPPPAFSQCDPRAAPLVTRCRRAGEGHAVGVSLMACRLLPGGPEGNDAVDDPPGFAVHPDPGG